MGHDERVQLTDEIYLKRPNLLASVVVQHQMGASLPLVEGLPDHPAGGLPGDEGLATTGRLSQKTLRKFACSG